MVLIPPDAGIRMRMQTDASLLQPVQPTHEIASDLPELQPGQPFSARIMEVLPDNTYKALVAGKLLTLQLPEGASPGDTLELVVVDRTVKSVIAQRVDAQSVPTPGAQAYANANISRTGQMIGQLLLPQGEQPQPAPLNQGQPLLPQAPVTAADLVPTLAKAVSESGLFYEAHQAEWIAGRRPMEALQAEPQAQIKPGIAESAAAPVAEATSRTTSAAVANVSTASASGTAPLPAATAGTGTSAGTTTVGASDDGTVRHSSNPLPSVPDQLRPIVQQQLDAVATQRLAWHGEVWPGQVMDLQIERERTEDREARTDATEAPRWNTTLRLTMPYLGAIDATLQMSGNQLRLRLATTSAQTATDLRANTTELVQALGTAGVATQSIEVASDTE